MKPRLLVMREIDHHFLDYLSNYFETDYQPSFSREQFLTSLESAQAILNYGIKIDEELIQHAPRLKLVSNISVGYDNFDID